MNKEYQTIYSKGDNMDRLRKLILENYDDLTDSEKYIVKYLLNYSNEASKKTLDELAETCSVSKSTIIRFTKNIGLDGYSELKVLLKLHSLPSDNFDSTFVDNICDSDIQNINYYRNYNFEPIIRMLSEAPQIYIYGTGLFQRGFVKEFHRLFLNIGVWVRVIEGQAEFKSAIHTMKDKDCLIINSASGEVSFLDQDFDILELKGVKILSFTSTSSNTLAYNSDFNISIDIDSEKLLDIFHFDNIVAMYIPLKLLFVHYINHKAQEHTNISS